METILFGIRGFLLSTVVAVARVLGIGSAGATRSGGRLLRSFVGAAGGIAITAMVTAGVALAVTIVGTPKGETLNGSPHADKIYGKGGNDRLYGYGGNDLLVGGKGADLLDCGTGRDVAIADTSDKLKGCEVVKGLPKLPPAPPANAEGLYIALGTSISAGAGASAYSKQWVNLYFRYLASNGSGVTRLWSVVQPFDNTSDKIRAIGVSRAVAVIKLPSDTLRVTLDVGLPDLRYLQGCDHPNNPACPFAENLRAILKTLNTELAQDPGNETIQIMEYFNPYIRTAEEGAWRALLLGDDLKISCSGTGRALGLNDLIHCIALEQNAIPVDVLPAFDAAGTAFLDPLDQFHPNDAGNLAIAKAFGGAVEQPR
jgi:RTX calcium-binding nonapeptide repeat (4 copies)